MDDVGEQLVALRSILRDRLVPELAEFVLAHARWAFRLERTDGPGPVRMGGDALLSPGAVWPQWHGRSLDLIAVVDIAAMRKIFAGIELPYVDLVNIFYDLDNPCGDPPDYIGGHCAQSSAAREASLQSSPVDAVRLAEVHYTGRMVLTLPGWDEPVMVQRLGVEARNVWLHERMRDVTDAFQSWHDIIDQSGTCDEGQIGGWPYLYQNPVFNQCETRCRAEELGVRFAAEGRGGDAWRQLAQFGWNSLIDPFVGDTRLHVCYDSTTDQPLSRTWVEWQGT